MLVTELNPSVEELKASGLVRDGGVANKIRRGLRIQSMQVANMRRVVEGLGYHLVLHVGAHAFEVDLGGGFAPFAAFYVVDGFKRMAFPRKVCELIQRTIKGTGIARVALSRLLSYGYTAYFTAE